MISTYHPNKKYKIVEFTNGLGEKWYNIQTIGYLWNSWFKLYYETDYGMCGFIPDFVSEKEAIDYLKKEKIKYEKNILSNKISCKQTKIIKYL